MVNMELLAPVGNMESLYAAINNGANAVYLGGKMFSARHYASNFDDDEMSEIVIYAHLRSVKVYVAINTVIDESEMIAALDYIRFLGKIGVDAVIVQDLGLASNIAKLIPNMEIHGSTQMTINNLEGANFLAEIGFKRVVLAREVPLSEIKYIYANCRIELEVFIHGALCVCYSGQCLMSSVIGGRSGNRGKCAQPCRMPSAIVDKDDKAIPGWEGKYFLSPKDLNTIDYIDQIRDSGVVSLKIEGRMKRAEYVATIVKSYRKALDDGQNKINFSEKTDMAQIFNRGFTKGIMGGDFGRDFISIDRADNRGIELGRINKKSGKHGFLELFEDLNPGDGIEYKDKSGEYKGFKSKISGKKGETIEFDLPLSININESLYKSSSIELLERAKEDIKKGAQFRQVDFFFQAKLGERPILQAWHKDYFVSYMDEDIIKSAEKLAMTEDKIAGNLMKTGGTVFNPGEIKIEIEDNLFIPISLINLMRREVLIKLEEEILIESKLETDEKNYKQGITEIRNRKVVRKNLIPKLCVKVLKFKQLKQLNLSKLDRVYLDFTDSLGEAFEELKLFNGEVFIALPKICYHLDFIRIKNMLDKHIERIDGVVCNNLGVFNYIKKEYPNLSIHGDMGLNIFNSDTAQFLKNNGVGSVLLSQELNIKQIKTIINRTDESVELLLYGLIPVMTMDHCPMAIIKNCKDKESCNSCNFSDGYKLKDRAGVKFPMIRKDNITNIYNAYPIAVLDSLNKLIELKPDYLRLDFTVEENVREIQEIYYDYLNGKITDYEMQAWMKKMRESCGITNGHYYRGVV